MCEVPIHTGRMWELLAEPSRWPVPGSGTYRLVDYDNQKQYIAGWVSSVTTCQNINLYETYLKYVQDVGRNCCK